MARTKTPYAARIVRHLRLRQHLAGTAERPRLNVFRSGRYTYAQVVDDGLGRTLAAASSRELPPDAFAKTDAAGEVGKLIAERAKAQGVKRVVFDRGGYKYHGRVKALAESARKEGLEF
ncbi:MAG: 50S ribosomal protein L18 [Chloroflexi bacterium]|nr:50S ribosomal protein L18 [Chloroflexota bacterium]MCH7656565.1 50S ribosomal protein L18 [Chloroflexota bacterium]